jgi:hypothetical protein
MANVRLQTRPCAIIRNKPESGFYGTASSTMLKGPSVALRT